MKTRPVGADVFHADRRTNERTDGRTDRNDEANGLFSQICERAYKPIVDCGIGKSQCFFLDTYKTYKFSVDNVEFLN